MKTSWVLGVMGLSIGACATAAPPPAPPPKAPVAASVALPPAVETAPPVPVAQRCADAKDIELCERACAASEAGACVQLGELFLTDAGADTALGFSKSYAMRAFTRGCTQGDKAGCEQREAGLSKLRTSCKEAAKTCVALGRVLTMLDEPHDQEVDFAFERACTAGDADACQERGGIHAELEPRKLHFPLAEKSLDRGCLLGSASACCGLLGLYRSAGQEKKADAAFKRLEVANEKAEGRLACDHFNMARPPRVTITAKAEPASAQALGKDHTALLEEVLGRKLSSCYAEPQAPTRLELELVLDGAAKLVKPGTSETERCVEREVALIHLPKVGSPRAAFELSFQAVLRRAAARETARTP